MAKGKLDCKSVHGELTKNQSLVMAELSGTDCPRTAYALLDELRDQGIRAPLQVYRALEKLVDLGLVHRIESLNAFVACRHEACETQNSVAFVICEKCEQVSEVSDHKLVKRISDLTEDIKFALQKTTIELRGICTECQKS